MPKVLKFKDMFGEAELKVSVWSDFCWSIEMTSLEQIVEVFADDHGLELSFQLHTACDTNPPYEELILQKHRPAHFSVDLFARDLGTGVYERDLCNNKHDMPQGCLDLYVCGHIMPQLL